MQLGALPIRSTSGREFVTDPRRKSPRRAVAMPGEVSVGDKSCRMTCQIIDMSATGARLHLNQLYGRATINGDRIALYFDKQCTCVECRIVWLAGNQLGVQFRSAFHRCGRNPLPIAKSH